MSLEEWLKNKVFATFAVGIAFGIIIYAFHDYGIADSLIITILAFLSSDILSKCFIRGKHGILQIRLFGTQAQPKGYGFVAFFLAILVTAIIINAITDLSVTFISMHYNDPIKDLFIGLFLSGLVYVDMNVKFYSRKKS